MVLKCRFLCNFEKYVSTGESLMKKEMVLKERKILFSLGGCGFLKGKLKIEEKAVSGKSVAT